MNQESLETLSQTIKNDLISSVKKIRRLRVKAVLKTAVTTTILIAGVATTLLIPNPVSSAVVIGAAAVLSGSEGVKHTLKRMKSIKKIKKLIQKSNKETDEQLFVSKVKASVNDQSQEQPSAPPQNALEFYPNLRV